MTRKNQLEKGHSFVCRHCSVFPDKGICDWTIQTFPSGYPTFKNALGSRYRAHASACYFSTFYCTRYWAKTACYCKVLLSVRFSPNV